MMLLNQRQKRFPIFTVAITFFLLTWSLEISHERGRKKL